MSFIFMGIFLFNSKSFDRFKCSFFSAHAAHVFQQQQTLPLLSVFIMRTFKFRGTLIVRVRIRRQKEGADRQIFLKTPRNIFFSALMDRKKNSKIVAFVDETLLFVLFLSIYISLSRSLPLFII